MSVKITPVKIWRRKDSIGSLMGKRGTVESYTIVHVAPAGYTQYAPFPVAIVKMANGQKHIGQVVDYKEEDLKQGAKVVAVLRRQRTEGKKDVIPYVIKFRPL